MSTSDTFVHVTEREADGTWEDCGYAALLETVRDGFPDGASIPATAAEREALRAAAGQPEEHKGATVAQLVAAAELRYQLAGGYVVTPTWSVVAAALLEPSARLVVQGSMAAVPASLRRWDPTFRGGHAVAARGRIWCDPLAPAGGYSGELIALATWEAFFRGLPGAQAFITKVGGLRKESMAIYERRNVTGHFTIPAGTTVPGFAPAALGWTVVKRWPPQDKPSSAAFDYQLVRVSGETKPSVLFHASSGFFAGLFVSAAQVVETIDPDPTPYSKADVDAAYQRGKTEGDTKHQVTLSIDGNPVSRTEV